MSELNDNGLASFLSSYGLIDRILVSVWGVLAAYFLVHHGDMSSGMRGLVSTGGLFTASVLLPPILFRLGVFPQAIGRFALGLGVALYGYETAGIFIENYRHVSYEAQMIALDEALFGGHASVWMQNIHHPLLTEYLQTVYIFYFPQVVLVAFALLYKHDFSTYYQYLVCMLVSFMVTHTFYVLVPVQSPFLLVDQGLFTDVLTYDTPLHGIWIADNLRQTLLSATTMRHDCFPSGHTMHSLVTLFFAYKVSKRFGMFMNVIVVSIIFSTLYLRYHYAVDLLVGLVFAVALVAIVRPIAERAYEREKKPELLVFGRPAQL